MKLERLILSLFAFSIACSANKTPDPAPSETPRRVSSAPSTSPPPPREDTSRHAPLTEGTCKGWSVDACVHVGMGFVASMRDDLGLPYLEQACALGSSRGCHELGEVYYTRDRRVRDDSKRTGEWLAIFQKLCRDGHHSSCARLAGIEAAGSGWDILPQDAPRAVETMRRLCDETGDHGCAFMAAVYHHGSGDIEADPAKGDAYLVKWCETFPSGGCYNLARAHETKRLVSQPVDLSKVPGLFKTSCEAGDARACRRLSTLYKDGQHGVTPDEGLAATYFNRACFELEDFKSCEDLAYNQLQASNTSAFVNAHELMCSKGYVKSCQLLVIGYLYETFPVPNHEARGHELLGVACKHGGAQTCLEVGRAYYLGFDGLKKDVTRGLELMELACSHGEGEACRTLALKYLTGSGEGIEQDASRAVHLHDKGCQAARDRTQCHTLGEWYTSGEHVPQDATKAQTYFKRGCELGLERSCAALTSP